MSCGSKRSLAQTASRAYQAALSSTKARIFRRRSHGKDLSSVPSSGATFNEDRPPFPVRQQPLSRAVDQDGQKNNGAGDEGVEVRVGVHNHQAVLDALDHHRTEHSARKDRATSPKQ